MVRDLNIRCNDNTCKDDRYANESEEVKLGHGNSQPISILSILTDSLIHLKMPLSGVCPSESLGTFEPFLRQLRA